MRLFVIIGERSGEIHACQVLNELKTKHAELQIYGTGGDEFAAIANQCYYHINDLNVLGFSEALKNYRRLKNIQLNLKAKLIAEEIDAVLLVDYVGFNLRFAKIAKELGKTVFFYISPQVWVWKERRIVDIKKYVDYLIVLFPFEVDFYRKKASYQAYYFGHPLSRIKDHVDQNIAQQFQSQFSQKKCIALIPGSRKREIDQHITTLLEAAYQLYEQDQRYAFFIPVAENININVIKDKITQFHHAFHFINENRYSYLAQCDFAWVVSGTVSLEIALLNVAQIIVRRDSFLTYLIAHYFLKIPYFSLVNILLQQQACQEFIQHHFNTTNLIQCTKKFFTHQTQEEKTMDKFHTELVQMLDDNSVAYKKTAEFIQQKLTKPTTSRKKTPSR